MGGGVATMTFFSLASLLLHFYYVYEICEVIGEFMNKTLETEVICTNIKLDVLKNTQVYLCHPTLIGC